MEGCGERWRYSEVGEGVEVEGEREMEGGGGKEEGGREVGGREVQGRKGEGRREGGGGK